MTDFKALLRILSEADVEFIVIGGVAAAVRGAGDVRSRRRVSPNDR